MTTHSDAHTSAARESRGRGGRIVITAVDCMTAVGLHAESTAASVRAGVSGLRLSDQYEDSSGSPIVESCIPWLKQEEEPPAANEPEPLDDGPAPGPAWDEEESEAGEGEGIDEESEPEASEDADAYELARQADDVERAVQAAHECLAGLLMTYFGPGERGGGAASLFLGVAEGARPGPRFEGARQESANGLLALLSRRVVGAELSVLRTGNASSIHGLKLAAASLASDPSSMCVVGAFDSLLSNDTLNWYEAAERLKSGSLGRNHGLSPAEAVGFAVVEMVASAERSGRRILAEVAGIGLATEPSPVLSDRPSRGQGLTEACRIALAESGVPPREVSTVLGDLDGEFHRAKEWALAETRCFGSAGERVLVHPADCLGSVGASSSAVLIAIAAVGISRRWFTAPVLVFSSDDAGECGAVVLTPPSDSERS